LSSCRTRRPCTTVDVLQFGDDGAISSASIAHDVVAYIDAHYRTIPKRTSAAGGHSMGGYGASRIGMNIPDVFGSLYIMSPAACPPARQDPSIRRTRRSGGGQDSRGFREIAFRLARSACVRAAWSPNRRTLRYIRSANKDEWCSRTCSRSGLPTRRWRFVDQYIGNLRQYPRIACDVGDQDGLRVARQAARDPGQLWDCKHVRGLFGHAYQRSRSRFQNFVLTVFQQERVLWQNCL